MIFSPLHGVLRCGQTRTAQKGCCKAFELREKAGGWCRGCVNPKRAFPAVPPALPTCRRRNRVRKLRNRAQEQIKSPTSTAELGVGFGPVLGAGGHAPCPLLLQTALVPALLPTHAGVNVLHVTWQRKVKSAAFGEFPNKSLI